MWDLVVYEQAFNSISYLVYDSYDWILKGLEKQLLNFAQISTEIFLLVVYFKCNILFGYFNFFLCIMIKWVTQSPK